MHFVTQLRKLKTEHLENEKEGHRQKELAEKKLVLCSANVDYSLALVGLTGLEKGESIPNKVPLKTIPLSDKVGKKISLRATGLIYCVNCGRKIKKSFQQGYCFPCWKKLPQTDMCMVKPELCHFHKGTCRDESWGKKNCFISHTVYLSQTSNLKVGITRSYQEKNRWMDQGASWALPLGYVSERLYAGVVELALKKKYADKTVWSRMLFSDSPSSDSRKEASSESSSEASSHEGSSHLLEEKEKAYAMLQKENLGEIDFKLEESPLVYEFRYPILALPEAKKSYNLEKEPFIEDYLIGIKGQYLLFPSGVLNLRKYSGYEVEINFFDK